LMLICMHGFNEKEMKMLKRLDSPAKVQDFLCRLRYNPKDTCMSPSMVLRKRCCHCVEGAMLAAAALRLQGRKPLLVDLTASRRDLDHVIAIFKENGRWGAVSKTNHVVLRYREPVYASIRELVMSFFHEYTDSKGRKTLRSYSDPVDLSKLDGKGWMTSAKDVWFVPDLLIKVKHYPILNRSQIARLRRADPIEVRVGNILEWKVKKG